MEGWMGFEMDGVIGEMAGWEFERWSATDDPLEECGGAW